MREMHYDKNGSYGPHHDNMPAHASHLMPKSFFTQVAQPLLQSKFGALRVLAFPKAKMTFELDWGIDKYLYFLYYMAG